MHSKSKLLEWNLAIAVLYATCNVLKYGVKQKPIDIFAEVGQRERNWYAPTCPLSTS